MELEKYVDNYYDLLRENLKYIKSNDWTEIRRTKLVKKVEVEDFKSTIEDKTAECKVHDTLVDFAVERLNKFLKAYKDQKKDPLYYKFLNVCREAVEFHVERCNEYIKTYKYSNIDNSADKLLEVKFQQMISKDTAKISDIMSGFNLSLEDTEDVIEFYNDHKAPLIMHYKLLNLYPGIQAKLDKLNVDFERDPEPKMHILNKNAPEWDRKKHYFEQDPETLQYYIDEWNKCKYGIIIGGLYISPWMYYHINFFTTKYPITVFNEKTKLYETEDIVGVPPLRDNEWWVINDNYELAKKEGLMMFLAATRRAAKSTMQTSHLGFCVLNNKLELVVAGGSSKDLDVIQKNFEILQEEIHPAFRIPFILEGWGKRVELGIKTKENRGVIGSFLKIINMDGGSHGKSEIFAGLTPDAVIIDEIMKLPFSSQLESLKPAVHQPGGQRCVVILAGTSGNEDLAKDAFDYLRSPEENGVLNMPWELFNSRVPEEHRTWQERPFGTFIPAQMSAKEGMVKVDSNLADYLNINSKELRQVPIKVTDWGKAKELINKVRKSKRKNLETYTKEVLYFPMCPSDMLLSAKVNPFPIQEAIAHREYLKSIGGKGKKGFLTQRTNGEIAFEMDETAVLADYPFKGGFLDCPVVLYEDIPTERPVDYLYVCGKDDYKQDESGTDSLGSFHVYKLDVGADDMCGKIVASLATRPDPHEKLHHQAYLLQQAFNAKCFMENADMSYKDFLERRKVADRWLMTALDFEADLSSQSEGRRKYGWAPTPKNKKTLFQKFVHYTRRVFQIYDEEGNEIDVLGIQMIDDIGLLDEVIAYQEGNNVDRITSFMSCLAYEDYLNANYMSYNPNRNIEQRREENKKAKRNGGGNPFFRQSNNKFF